MKRDSRDAPKSVTLGFEDDCVTLPIDAILPLRALGKSAKSSRKYRQIVASIAQIGITAAGLEVDIRREGVAGVIREMIAPRDMEAAE